MTEKSVQHVAAKKEAAFKQAIERRCTERSTMSQIREFCIVTN